MTDLIAKRAAVVAEHAAQEKYDPHWKAEAAAGRPLSARPIAFQCDDMVIVMGDCVAKVTAAAREFVGRKSKYSGRLKTEPRARQAFAVCERLADQTGPTLELPSQQWNGVAFALGELGVDVILSDGSEE